MREPQILPATTTMGYWQVRIDNRNVTFVRDIPISITELTDTDPFGPATASLYFPMINPLEPIGKASMTLEWLRPHAPVEIIWTTTDDDALRGINAVNAIFPTPNQNQYIWRGYISSFDWDSGGNNTGLTVTCVGALRILDNALAAPTLLDRPVPVEWAMRKVINSAIERVKAPNLKLMVPYDFSFFHDYIGAVRYNPDDEPEKYLRPRHLKRDDWWSGLVTREMGQWDQVLSSYAAGVLQMLYTPNGRFSIRMAPDAWQPQMYHLSMFRHADDSSILRVNMAWPGVTAQVTSDYSQIVNRIYGSVSSTYSNTSFENEQWNPSGRSQWFEPFATADDSDIAMLREQRVTYADGLQPFEAMRVARAQIQRNADPGYTGTVTLTGVDPEVYDTSINGKAGGQLVPYPKQLARAGMSVQLNGLFGRTPGPVLFITESSHDVTNNSTTLTVDSKYRDYVTVDEIAARGRDSMRPLELMTVGQYSLTIADRLLPWQYELSGYVPFASRHIWKQYNDTLNRQQRSSSTFPDGWVAMTRAFPPKLYRKKYIRIPKAREQGRGTKNKPVGTKDFWNVFSVVSTDDPSNIRQDPKNSAVKLSSQGTISSFKMMCVDEDGNPLPVTYSVSLFAGRLGDAKATPKLLEAYHKNGRHYKKGAHYPFYEFAWSTANPDGTTEDSVDRLAAGALIRSWGTAWDKPGYWPWSQQRPGAVVTGMFVDDGGFSYDLTEANKIDPVMSEENTYWEDAAVSVVIFCDDKIDRDRYFIGRMYRAANV